MLSVGLTGNVASGKSSVARMFAEWGAVVIDADAIVHELQQPGTAVFKAMVEEFGREILAADGTLDRGVLRALIFNDPAARKKLNAITHPAVRARRDGIMAEARQAGTPIVVQDIPLLFEVLDPASFDAVVLVDAPIETRRARMERIRGLDPETAQAMIEAQIPSEEKRARATYVIDNDGSLDDLEARARAVWTDLIRRANGLSA
ncbi:MAG: dephospho-CoA kinase [Gemmatimonadales bacterium]|nr:dephospho-CoA kinase [Gemmatimonadales bacterium]